MAQQPADQQPAVRAPAGAIIDGATAAAIAAEGELKATIRTFQGDNPSAVYRYYWWHDNCYVRYQSVVISWSRPIIAIANCAAIASCLISLPSVPGGHAHPISLVVNS
jgi:hypothetical protein